MNIANPAIPNLEPVVELLALIADARARADDLGFGVVAIHLDQAFVRCEERLGARDHTALE